MRLYHFTILLLLCAPSLAARSFDGSGTFIVGVDIEAGTYRSGIGPNGHCYWERLSGLSGELGETIANELVQRGTVIVEIKPSDYAFKTRSCADWRRVDVTRSSVQYRGLAGAQARDSQTPPPDTEACSDKLWRKELESREDARNPNQIVKDETQVRLEIVMDSRESFLSRRVDLVKSLQKPFGGTEEELEEYNRKSRSAHCACPYNVYVALVVEERADGRGKKVVEKSLRCDAFSAYTTNQSDRPLCFPSDVPQSMLADWLGEPKPWLKVRPAFAYEYLAGPCPDED